MNLVIVSKLPTQVYLTAEEAQLHCIAGISVWERYSSPLSRNQSLDIVLAGCGTELTFEVLCASKYLRGLGLRVRVININDPLVLAPPGRHPHAIDATAFERLFPKGVPVLIAFHGYPSAVKGLLFDRPIDTTIFHIFGYMEEGTTTTPFHMLLLNKTSRYDLCIAALQSLPLSHALSSKVHWLISLCQHEMRNHVKYIYEHHKDPDDVFSPELIS